MSASSSKWGFAKTQAKKDGIKALVSSPISGEPDGGGLGSETLTRARSTSKSEQRPRSTSKSEQKRLMEICRDGNLDIARQFCNKNSNILCNSINSPVDQCGNLPLHLTVSQNDHIMTCLLVLKGANPNLANKSGITPLMIAERMNFQKIADVLTICGAISSEPRPNQPSPKRTSLVLEKKKDKNEASVNGNQGLFGSFSKRPFTGPEKIDEEGKNLVQASMETGIMILPDAAYLGFQNQIISVIRQDTLKDTDESGSTVLMKAAYAGHSILVKDLLDLGCDPDAMDKTGNTALVWAVLSGKGEIVQTLYGAGANIDGAVPYSKKLGIKIKGQMTPLMAAAYHGHISIMSYLLKEKCDTSLRCGKGEGKTAVMVAACARRVEAVKLLLQHKAPFDMDIEQWLKKGAIQMKKISSDRNAWICLDGDNALHYKNKSSNPDLSLHSSNGFQIAKNNAKTKLTNRFSYYSTEEHDVIDVIYNLLQNKNSLQTNSLPPSPENSSPSTENESSPKGSSLVQRRPSFKRNQGYRNGLNLDKIIGTHSEAVLLLSEQIPKTGTELDELWIAVFQCVIQLVMAANKNIKQHYIAISAKINHCASEIVRQIEIADRKVSAMNSKEGFCDTLVRAKIRDLCKIITNDFPKQLMVATRMAIGVWPAPNAVSEMIKEAANNASACRELTLIANTLGYFPLLDKTFDITFQPFEETVAPEAESPDKGAEKDSSLKGGLSYAEYKRQNDLKLIQEMTKNMVSKDGKEESANEEENIRDAEFFGSLDALLKQFVGAATELKQVHDQHYTEEFINAASKVYTKADNLIEEINGFELLKEIGDDVLLGETDSQRLQTSGVKLAIQKFPVPLRFVVKEATDELKITAMTVMARGKLAASPNASATVQLDMLQSSIPCLRAVKKLVVVAKEAVVKVRATNIEERRKRDAWRKECLANEKVKQLFQMWESQVMTDIPKAGNQLTTEEMELLSESTEGIVFEEGAVKRVKGGKLIKLIEILTSHNATTDEEFETVFLMTHHSFCTSAALMDQLIKRYDITPPYGLNQRMFELYLDKKVVQVRLKVCHTMLHWIQNHFEEDFADNEFLINRFQDFIMKKVMIDFEHMGVQIMEGLKKQLTDGEKIKINFAAVGERPKPILSSSRFGADPLGNLMNDSRAFLDVDPLEMSRQLTLMEHDLYSKFQPYECLDQIWEGHLKKELAGYNQPKPSNPKRHTPGSSASDISKMIRHTNEFTFWIATSVVKNSQMKARVNMLKYFITMAQHCKELNNLTAVTTIVAGLSMGAISRLHKTWKSLETKAPKILETYKELQDLVSPKFQYANYRKYLKDMSVPAIPFLGVYLTDLTFLDLGNSDFLPDTNYINFEKRRKVFNLIREIQKFQQVQYPLQPVPQIQDFMKSLGESKSADDPNALMTEDQLYEKSMEVEAKEESSDDDDSD